MKRSSWYFRILLAVIAVPALWYTYFYLVRPIVLVAGAAIAWSPITEEVERVESPDHQIVAVVFQTNPSALEPYYYSVYLAKQGSHDLGKPVLDAFGKNDLQLTWKGPKLLVISYSDACIAMFHNHWNSMELQNGLYDVEIRLKPPEDDTPREPCA